MGKDHSPGGFHRENGYRSDLEIAEEAGTRINTSFGSGNHNVYIHNAEHTHEHFWYDPAACSSGYHGANVETASNHPSLITEKEEILEEGDLLPAEEPEEELGAEECTEDLDGEECEEDLEL